MIEKTIEINILFDFYGKLLTEKQFMAIDLYYNKDLSLSEIGDRLNVSRQGVFDLLKRAEKKLYEYEAKLGLVNKFKSNLRDIEDIVEYSEEIDIYLDKNKDNDDYIKTRIDRIKEIGKNLVDI